MSFWFLQISQTANQILDRFLPYEARAEICQKLVGFSRDLKAPKFHTEINWPLAPVAIGYLDQKLGQFKFYFINFYLNAESADLAKNQPETYRETHLLTLIYF